MNNLSTGVHSAAPRTDCILACLMKIMRDITLASIYWKEMKLGPHKSPLKSVEMSPINFNMNRWTQKYRIGKDLLGHWVSPLLSPALVYIIPCPLVVSLQPIWGWGCAQHIAGIVIHDEIPAFQVTNGSCVFDLSALAGGSDSQRIILQT